MLLDKEQYKYLTFIDILTELSKEYSYQNDERSREDDEFTPDPISIIIFCNTEQSAIQLSQQLLSTQQKVLRTPIPSTTASLNPHGFWEYPITSYVTPTTEENDPLSQMKATPCILITIDGLSAEGIEWSKYTRKAIFIHYDMAIHHEDYVLRIGRTFPNDRRFGKISIVFIVTTNQQKGDRSVLYHGDTRDCRELSRIEEYFDVDSNGGDQMKELPSNFAYEFISSLSKTW